MATAAAPVLACILAGCETVSSETSDGRPMPPRSRAVELAPESAPINAMSVLYGPKPGDSDANGRPDRLVVEMYLFARPYPVPTWREGTVVITAYPMGKAGTPDKPGAAPFHVWRIPTSQLALGRFRSLVGEGYKFQFSLLDDGGTDRVPGDALDFVARFEPATGGTVWGDGVRTISFAPAQAGEVR
jgi:hypothetical protein